MDKIAFVFSGQGDQYPGMGQDLAKDYPAFKNIFDILDSIRPGTSDMCFNGSEDELKETKNTQPCLYAFEIAAAQALINKGIKPSMSAGFSLGEVSAAAFTGVCSYEDGFRLVIKRGELMQRDAEACDTSMAAVLRLSEEEVRNLCGKYEGIYPVNFNCPGQITVSGLSCNMGDFLADVKAKGGRAVPLKVKGAFHSPFMKNAAEDFLLCLKETPLKMPEMPLYSDITAHIYNREPEKLLSEQIISPVMWEKLIKNMIGDGANTFIEIGPGRTLTNMIKKIDPEVKALSLGECL